MFFEVIVNVVVTGIIAVVPSAKDGNLTRLIAPNLTTIANTHAAQHVPEHFAYIEVHGKNWIPGSRMPDFRFKRVEDASTDERLVFILNSEQIEFGNAPASTDLVRTGPKTPADLRAPSAEERTSTAYEMDMVLVCRSCTKVNPKLWHVLASPKDVSMRMDLRGGVERVSNLKEKNVWVADGTNIERPFADEIVYQYTVPACGQRLRLTRKRDSGELQTDEIGLLSPEEEPIEVIIGNSPLAAIIPGTVNRFPMTGDHFGLFYDMFDPVPTVRPRVHLKGDNGVDVTGPRIPCIILRATAQDPPQ